ncbi:hypothetical protein OD91_0970 [Lutibacter sp. Hel_I_33_5]|uniref:M1 family metallopeptidase n=1 Tax=Lutibacter sp. Hel_I_33_5 TaxID=1566289 RepID=UPI0011AA37E4|nr:M1 family metallopeptidase [Lutibacter sp. Hel_I_33_5]TVZ55705.1 hypothetical protein OD91_0970 [Lutibacter sp. Hel_I_33_5]
MIVAQQNTISIKASLKTEKDVVDILQKIIFYNNSDSTLTKIYLHNWANSYKDRETLLSKRLIDDYNKSFYFSKEEERGYSKIINLSVDYKTVLYKEVYGQSDIIEIQLTKPLKSGDSITINTSYNVKIPDAKFTGYGKSSTNNYHLRFWHLIPAVHNKKWHLMSNLNMNDLYQEATNYDIEFRIPQNYFLESNLKEIKKEKDIYYLLGKNKTDIILDINKNAKFKDFKTKQITIKTDVLPDNIQNKLATEVLQRGLSFIEEYLGKYPHQDIFIDKITQRKDPILGINKLPKALSPFSEVFKWDLTMFKAISKKYIENTLLVNKRKDYWLVDGLQTYLLMEYTQKFYPEVKLLGKISNFWGIRAFNFAKLNFNDKYPFIYQFSARKFFDQSLTTSADSLSNFNRKIINRYKSGLGLRYIKGFIEGGVLQESFKEYYQKNKLKISSSKSFEKILTSKTDKDLSWFFGDYITTNKKIDYKIATADVKNDSIVIVIKNKRNITAPVALYGIKDKKIKFKKWITGVDSTKTIKVPKNGFDRLSLNYENIYPEYNNLNNWKSLKKRIFNKPLQLKFFKDIEDPYYTQLYYEPDIKYNYYDGLIIGAKLHNKPIIDRNFEFTITPSYGIKSKSITGSFHTRYSQYFEDSSIYRIVYGIGGSNLHYAPDLAYNTFNQGITVQFRRKSLRDVGSSFLSAGLININKEVPVGTLKTEQDAYSIFNLKYTYNRPDIINGLRFRVTTEFASDFSKLIGEIRYRKQTSLNTRSEFRIFAGTFLNNSTSGDYFSFGLDRANDYLFQLNYFGRSENSGIFSQQFILAEGGFKSILPTRFANEYMISFNSSIGIWKWLEIYNDLAFLKNRGDKVFLGYENGVRFNFVPNILEFYFPIYSTNGWEINQPNYSKNIRFVFTANLSAIYNFVRRGFL